MELPSGQRTSISATGLTLTPGVTYSMRVASVNHAGSIATYDTNGVLVDPTPPSVSCVVDDVVVVDYGDNGVVDDDGLAGRKGLGLWRERGAG